jgi:hypothetical protein
VSAAVTVTSEDKVHIAEVSAKILTSSGGNEGNPIPPNYGFSPGSGSANAIAADTGGDASATVVADLGVLRVTAQSNVGTPDPATTALARATAAFADAGAVTKPGGTLGDPVHAFVTVQIEGAHNNDVSGISDAHLFIDFQEPGVYFNSVWGHEYRLTVAGGGTADLSITKTDGVTSPNRGAPIRHLQCADRTDPVHEIPDS